jgi:hypothetical protein
MQALLIIHPQVAAAGATGAVLMRYEVRLER